MQSKSRQLPRMETIRGPKAVGRVCSLCDLVGLETETPNACVSHAVPERSKRVGETRKNEARSGMEKEANSRASEVQLCSQFGSGSKLKS